MLGALLTGYLRLLWGDHGELLLMVPSWEDFWCGRLDVEFFSGPQRMCFLILHRGKPSNSLLFESLMFCLLFIKRKNLSFSVGKCPIVVIYPARSMTYSYVADERVWWQLTLLRVLYLLELWLRALQEVLCLLHSLGDESYGSSLFSTTLSPPLSPLWESYTLWLLSFFGSLAGESYNNSLLRSLMPCGVSLLEVM